MRDNKIIFIDTQNSTSVRCGDYKILVEKAGYYPFKEKMTIKPAESLLEIKVQLYATNPPYNPGCDIQFESITNLFKDSLINPDEFINELPSAEINKKVK